MNSNVVHIPSKRITKKYKRMDLEIWFNDGDNIWQWQVVHRKPILYTGEASTCQRAIAMAKRKIDNLQES